MKRVVYISPTGESFVEHLDNPYRHTKWLDVVQMDTEVLHDMKVDNEKIWFHVKRDSIFGIHTLCIYPASL